MDIGALIALLGLLLGGLTFAGALFGAWALGRMQAERNAIDANDDDDSNERLARMERMIEAMALDMERLAEAQRLLARRLPATEARQEKAQIPGPSPRV